MERENAYIACFAPSCSPAIFHQPIVSFPFNGSISAWFSLKLNTRHWNGENGPRLLLRFMLVETSCSGCLNRQNYRAPFRGKEKNIILAKSFSNARISPLTRQPKQHDPTNQNHTEVPWRVSFSNTASKHIIIKDINQSVSMIALLFVKKSKMDVTHKVRRETPLKKIGCLH